jgi:hypothetical protein
LCWSISCDAKVGWIMCCPKFLIAILRLCSHQGAVPVFPAILWFFSEKKPWFSHGDFFFEIFSHGDLERRLSYSTWSLLPSHCHSFCAATELYVPLLACVLAFRIQAWHSLKRRFSRCIHAHGLNPQLLSS